MRRFVTPHLRRIGTRLHLGRDWYLYIVAALIGLLMGCAAVAFIWPLRQSEAFAEYMGHSRSVWWLVLLAPALGGMITGVLVTFMKSDGAGPGVTAVIYAVQRRKGRMPLRLGLRKWLASTATIGTGGSAGAEGPIVTIGAVVGSTVARLLGTGSQHTGTLLGCGAAAGLASVFNAPIAGIFFVMEILLRDFSLRTFTPIVIAAVVASATAQGVLGDAAIFDVGEGFFRDGEQFSALQIPTYLLLGLACGLLGACFVRALDFSEQRFSASSIPPIARPAVGALGVGILGVGIMYLAGDGQVPGFMGNGYPTIKHLLDPAHYYAEDTLVAAGPLLMAVAALALVKIVATSLTVGSGGAGGLFAPSLLVGAATGAFIGYCVKSLGWFPDGSPAHFALVGMAAMVAATTHAPLTAILIVYEVTQSYQIILPLMFATIIATIVSRGVHRQSVYTFKLARLGVRMGAMSDLTVLRRLTADDVVLEEPVIVARSDGGQRLIELSEEGQAADFVVVNDRGHYCGMITSTDLRAALVYREAVPLLQISEIQRSDLPTVLPDETLDIVLDKFSRSDVAALAVVAADGETVAGVITRTRLMNRYQAALRRDEE